jgi:phage terminase Nu1 subunit (DNA packaging protein)
LTDRAVSQKEFAELMKWAPSYVTKLKQADRLVFDEHSRVLVEASKARINETAQSGETAPAADAGGEKVGTIAYWNRREAAARAQLRERELAQADGTLVQAADVQAAAAEAGGALRAALEGLPDQLAPALVTINDEAKIHAMLVEHIESILKEVSGKLMGAASVKSEAPK